MFFPGALQLRLPRNFPQAMSLLRDSKRYPAAGALCCYNHETKIGVKEAASLFKNHTYTSYNPREYFKLLDSFFKERKIVIHGNFAMTGMAITVVILLYLKYGP